MTEQVAATQVAATGSAQQQKKQSSQRHLARALAITIAGGVLTGGAIVLTANNALIGGTSDLSVVAAAEVAAAMPTIDPAVSSQLAAAAKNCSVPLAHVTIAKLPGASGGAIRIRSGNYVSPPFQLADAPQRIAIPFPEPYPLGHGVIGIEGQAKGALVSLSPTWSVETLSGSALRNVVWKPGNPC